MVRSACHLPVHAAATAPVGIMRGMAALNPKGYTILAEAIIGAGYMTYLGAKWTGRVAAAAFDGGWDAAKDAAKQDPSGPPSGRHAQPKE